MTQQRLPKLVWTISLKAIQIIMTINTGLKQAMFCFPTGVCFICSLFSEIGERPRRRPPRWKWRPLRASVLQAARPGTDGQTRPAGGEGFCGRRSNTRDGKRRRRLRLGTFPSTRAGFNKRYLAMDKWATCGETAMKALVNVCIALRTLVGVFQRAPCAHITFYSLLARGPACKSGLHS